MGMDLTDNEMTFLVILSKFDFLKQNGYFVKEF
jgi:hypothetical protein